jgi:peptidoglycan/xylan/chitin deacetylase (PgdA/CDA1 family)
MLDVYLTVDTEVWPFVPGWPVSPMPPEKQNFDAELGAYIYGRTAGGNYGLPYQLATLARYGLKATYFVEPFFSVKAGTERLAEVVDLVQSGGQEVQLHVHTEWLREVSDPSFRPGLRQHLRHYDEDEQATIIARGTALLRNAGVASVCAFRAGNFGADNATLRALARNGIRYDSSHNLTYLGKTCAVETGSPIFQPVELEGVVEFPVSVFSDWPGHYRHAQIAATSFPELSHVLVEAAEAGWRAFVVLLHGFELIGNVRDPAALLPDAVNVERFTKLCGFLSQNSHLFRTRVFSELDPATAYGTAGGKPVRSSVHRTLRRYGEQALARFARG